jgi:chromate transporter
MPATPPPLQPTLAAPRSTGELFVAFTWLALQGFGGVLAVVQRELVERKGWMTQEEFVEDWAVAQILPGPNVVNLALMIGSRHFGLPGAAAACAGLFAAPLCVVLALVLLYSGLAHLPAAQGALRGMGAVSAGLIAGTGFKLSASLRQNPMGRWVCALLAVATFAAIGLLRVPLMWVLLGLGLGACAWAYLRIGRLDAGAREAA